VNDKQTMREVARKLRPDIDDAEFEVLWVLYVAGRPGYGEPRQ